ncbi:MAG: PocR ligand-binding domain-containing protein [Candidatus Omnitrophica bacterium]|nr:PocR ligand-binding domain-containing protein [Candidatus Omnitrophota bacterium]
MEKNKTKEQLIQEIESLKNQIKQLENKDNASAAVPEEYLHACQTLFENLPQKIFIKDTQSVYLFCNKAYADTLNITQQEIKGKTDFDFFNKELAKKYRADDQRIMRSAQIEQLEEPYEYRGKPRITHTVKIPIKDNNGNITQIVGIFTDIAARKNTEEVLAEKQRLLNKVGDIAKIGGWEFDLEQNGKPTWTKGTYDIVELDYDQPIPDINEHIHWYLPEYQDMVKQKIHDLIEHEQPMQYDAMFKTKKGNTEWARVIGEVVKKDNKVIKIRGTIQNITEIKKSEQFVLENQARFQRIVDSNMIGIFFWDAQGQISEANDAFLDMVGYTRQELLEGKINWWDMTPLEYFDLDNKNLAELKIKDKISPFEKEYFHKNGTRIPIIIGATVLNDNKDQGVCFILDISERKKAQGQIKDLAKFPEENPNPVMRISLKGEIIYANKAAHEFLDLWNCQQGPCLDQEITNTVFQAYNSGKIKTLEIKCKNKIYLVTFSPILESKYVNIYAWDITRRKLLENALEKRIIAMSQPLDEAVNIDFDVLFNLKEIQELQDLFANSANVASRIICPDGTPITKPSNFCRLCRDIIRNTERGRKNCAISDAIIGKGSETGQRSQPCLSAGLWTAGARIIVGGKHIANWLVGQVRNEEQNEEKIKQYAREIGADEQEFVKAFNELPIMSKQQFQNVADTLFAMANLLSSAAYQNIQQARFIAQCQKAENDLLMSNKRFQELFNNMSSGVAIYEAVDNGADFVFKDFNKAGERIDKISREQLIGRRVTEIFSAVKEFGLFAVFKQVFQTGNPEHFADKIYQDNRIKGWRRNYVYKLPTGEIIAIYDDITEQKKLEQQEKEIFAAQTAAEVEKQKALELAQAYEERKLMQSQLLQAEKMASIGQLGAGVAHELNSPLSGVLSLLRSYKKEKAKNSEEYDDLTEMEKACEHMAKIIKSLNSFSRQSTEEMEDVDCNQTIKSILSFTAYQLEKKSVIIEIDFAPDLAIIRANENQIQQIIINMVTNASDALSTQGKFKISTKNLKIADKAYIEILFKDNGSGIKAEDLNKIFDPFFTTKRPGGGVGLGLSIVYKIVETHKGTISVDSKEGQGTVFTIRLPVN